MGYNENCPPTPVTNSGGNNSKKKTRQVPGMQPGTLVKGHNKLNLALDRDYERAQSMQNQRKAGQTGLVPAHRLEGMAHAETGLVKRQRGTSLAIQRKCTKGNWEVHGDGETASPTKFQQGGHRGTN